jgi:hypothetical protein
MALTKQCTLALDPYRIEIRVPKPTLYGKMVLCPASTRFSTSHKSHKSHTTHISLHRWSLIELSTVWIQKYQHPVKLLCNDGYTARHTLQFKAFKLDSRDFVSEDAQLWDLWNSQWDTNTEQKGTNLAVFIETSVRGYLSASCGKSDIRPWSLEWHSSFGPL